MKPVLILVDFSAIAYACWRAAEAAKKASDEKWTEHLGKCEVCVDSRCANPPATYDPHQVLKTNLRQKMGTIEEHTGVGPNAYTMVKDSHAKWKYDIFPEYKGHRERTHDPRPESEEYLRSLYAGMQWVSAPGNEADDAIATLVKLNQDQRAIVIVSGDKDLWQLLGPNVKIFRPVTKKFVTIEEVEKDFKVTDPRFIRLYKTFWGDPSDNIPNVAPRMQKQLLPLIHDANGNLLKTLEMVDGRVNETCLEHLRKNQAQLLTNWHLTGLNSYLDLEWR